MEICCKNASHMNLGRGTLLIKASKILPLKFLWIHSVQIILKCKVVAPTVNYVWARGGAY